jgi:hypothetical protein
VTRHVSRGCDVPRIRSVGTPCLLVLLDLPCIAVSHTVPYIYIYKTSYGGHGRFPLLDMPWLVTLLRFILFLVLPESLSRLLTYVLLILYPENPPERVDVPLSTADVPGQSKSSPADFRWLLSGHSNSGESNLLRENIAEPPQAAAPG